MSVEWDKIADFIKSVGLPVGLLLLIVTPIVYAIYRVIVVYGPLLAQKIIGLIDSLEVTQKTISDGITSITATNAQSQSNHDKTHEGIKVGIQAIYEGCEAFRKLVAHTNDQELQRKVLPHIDTIERLIAQR